MFSREFIRGVALVLPVVAGLVCAGTAAAAMKTDAARAEEASPKRLKEIEMHLPEHAAWPLEHTKPSDRMICDATSMSLPDCSEECYRGYSRTGSRMPYQKNVFQRTAYLVHCAAAAAERNDADCLRKAEEIIGLICDMKSWVLPAHDTKLDVLEGRTIVIDLGSSELTRDLAEALVLLKGRLPAALEARARAEIERRTFAPYREIRNATSATGKALKGNFWFYTRSNWCAVCHGNVVIAALALIEDRKERAAYVEAAERGMRFFLESFLDDGYCTEGMGYWNYGYGHFLDLVFAVRKATGGFVDYSRSPRAKKALAYAFGYRLDARHCPSYSDGGGGQPGPRYLDMGIELWPEFAPLKEGELAPRDFFPNAMVYIGRTRRLQIGVKGGNNDELHNHNDVGSWTLVADGVEIAGDPGHEEYTAKTFGPHRYESRLLNSFGHPVPKVADDLQGTGARYRGRIVETNFTDSADLYVLELSEAYPMVEKKYGSLIRKVELNRKREGVIIADVLNAKRKIAFESAFVTAGEVEKGADKGKFTVSKTEGSREARIAVQIVVKAGDPKGKLKTDAVPWELVSQTIPNPGHPDVQRLSVVFSEPVSSAVVGWRVRPAD